MHIMEGFLPLQWCLFWYFISFTVVIYGVIKIKKITEESPELKPLLALSGAFMFLLSALKLPSFVPGSSSHPTGNGLGAIIFGPAVTSVLATIVLLFQALLLAHGGITTLGANIFAMGIAGPFIAWIIYRGSSKFGIKSTIAIFLAAFSADMVTYITTASQLALAFPIPAFESALLKFMAIYAPTQILLAVAEGIFTVIVWRNLVKLMPDKLERLNLIQNKKIMEAK